MIRKGRNDSLDKVFTYIVIAAIIAGVIGVFFYLHQSNPGGGMFWQKVVVEEKDPLEPGNLIRVPVPLDEEMRHAKKIVFQLEIEPENAEVEFGLIGRGQELRDANLIGDRVGKSVARAPGRRIVVTDSAPPGNYEVAIRNITQTKAYVNVRVILKKS